MSQPQIQPAPVRRSLIVKADPQRSFAAFTANMASWWPPTHTIGGSQKPEVVLEGRVGGRWYERSPEGAECEWGKVLVWEPPARLVMTWNMAAAITEVELTFATLGPALTRVAVEHRGWEQLTDEELARDCALEGGYLGGAYREGWARVLGRFAATLGGPV